MTDKDWQCDLHDSEGTPVTGCYGCMYATAYRRGWNEACSACSEDWTYEDNRKPDKDLFDNLKLPEKP